MRARGQDHIHALTSLRFFAASYVLLFHSGGPAMVNSEMLPSFAENFFLNGYLGVPFFFILSGFILTYVYFDRLTTGEATARYAMARFARVYPVYLLSLLLMVPFVPSTDLSHALPQFFLLQSWIPLSLADGSVLDNWNMQSWTLSVELLFYLMFPLLIRALEKMSVGIVASLAIAVCILMLAFRLPELRGSESLLYPGMGYVPLSVLRVPEFVFGVVLGTLYRRGSVPSMPAVLSTLMGLTLVVLCSSRSPWVAPIAAILFGGIIVLVPTSLSSGRFKRLLKNRTMILLGGASYALYILQLPVHLTMGWMFSGSGHELLGRILYFPAVLAISVLVFLRYEEKMRALLRNMHAAKPRAA